MQLNGDKLILLPVEDTKSNYMAGFWRWVEQLANGDFEAALESLFWARPTSWTPEKLKERIEGFFGGAKPWVPVIPNQRLIGVVNDSAEIELRNGRKTGWLLAMIPVTTTPQNPKDDKIPLMGIGVSFFVHEHAGHYVLEFEIFHA